jgi:hypothetical protein
VGRDLIYIYIGHQFISSTKLLFLNASFNFTMIMIFG